MAKALRQVFISAAKSDNAWARDLSERLEKAGIDTWVPVAEILPGANWSREIGRALDRADAMVVLVSPDAMKSDWVRREIQFALGEERFENRLIPVQVRRTPSDDIPWILRELQWAEGNQTKLLDKY